MTQWKRNSVSKPAQLSEIDPDLLSIDNKQFALKPLDSGTMRQSALGDQPTTELRFSGPLFHHSIV